MKVSDNVAQAKRNLGGQDADVETLFKLAKGLKSDRQFDYARRILARALSHPKIDDYEGKTEVIQQHALCTYKDQDLPAHERVDVALQILKKITNYGDNPEEKVETFGLYGAIYKRKWEVDGQRLNLERSLHYYRLGHAYDDHCRIKQGYASINAAYLLELLAHQEASEQLGDKRLAALAASAPRWCAPPQPEGNGAAPASADTAAIRRAEADAIRRQIVENVPEDVSDPPGDYDWWKIVTVAEAYFGLGDYKEAAVWLTKGADLHDRLKGEGKPPVPDWEWESTLRQLVSLARIRGDLAASGGGRERAWDILDDFIGRRFGATGNGGGSDWRRAEGARRARAALESAKNGKVGLGLSGGGFRASLYHVGVLAKLAELDVLRHVEVLSCVSGGSIVGAHYYLELRRLLQQKPDAKVTREDYVDIVQRVERDFLAGVQRNIRSRIAAEFWTNVRLAFSRTYTRTNRAGELYERELFARVADGAGDGELPDPEPLVDAWTGVRGDGRGGEARDPAAPIDGWTGAPRWLARLFGKGDSPRWLNGLYITPRGEDEKSFKPKYDNWRRAAKVPMLVLNATTLNTGHNWQFTASWMGEPPAGIDAEVDASDRLRRMYYGEAPGPYQSVRLGYAVAASACVPGLFEPLVLDRLYPDRTVRLVDGGVQDNQGITAMLEQDCNVVLVSDASGQMESVKDPRSGFVGRMFGGVIGVLLRTKDVLMARVREAEYDDLAARRRSSLLRGMMYVHLTKDLDNDPVDWIGCDDPRYATEEALPVSRLGPHTRYGTRKEVQRLLSSIRTDLDSFTDAEAYALMASGYRMTEYEFPRAVKDFPASSEPTPNWRFLAVEERMQTAGDDPVYQSLLKQLKVAGSLAFKVWRLSLWLQILAGALALVALAAVVYAALRWLTPPVLGQKLSAQLVAALAWWNLDPTFGEFLSFLGATALMLVVGLFLGNWVMSIVQYKKTLTRALIHVGMCLFGFLVARLHVHAFDRLYLRVGGVRLNPHVFLCYVHEDAALAGQLDQWLRGQGLRTAVDGKDTLFSKARAKAIGWLIEHSNAVVFVSSPRSNPSKVCAHHIQHASLQGVRVIYADISGQPAGAAGNGANGGRPAGAGDRHPVVYLGTDEDGNLVLDDLDRLLRRIKDEPDPPAQPAPDGNGAAPAHPATAAPEQAEAAPEPQEAAPAAVETTKAETEEPESLARDDAAPAAGVRESTAPDEAAPTNAAGNGSKQKVEAPSQPEPVTPEETAENQTR